MAFSAHFTSTTFDTQRLPMQSVVLNASGILDPGPLSNPAALGYSAQAIDSTIEYAASSIGLDFIWDVSVQFPAATYFYGLSIGYNSTTYADNGIFGTTGSDVIFDPLGHNIIDTRGGADLIFAGGGNNAVRAGSGDDIVVTGAGNDTVDAGGGADIVYLHSGDDVARGRGGHDELRGGDGDDGLDGGGGRDRLFGGAGADTLIGGRGHDEIAGGTGDDILTGEAGRDRFLFALGDGRDTITDFDLRRDALDLSGLGVADHGDLAGIAAMTGDDLVLSFVGGDQLTLIDTSLAELASASVDFA